MKLHIYIFRHGETYFNRSKRFAGMVNSRLTPKGIEQTILIAEKLRSKRFQMAFKTSLSRSSDSLKIVLRYHPECKQVIVDDRMIERSYGDFEKRFHKTVIKKYGKAQFELWHRSYKVPPLGGESIKMVEKRVLSFVKDLLILLERKKINVAICAHNNSMRPFRRYFENLTVKQMMVLENPYDKYFDYAIEC
ncbi:MAG: histidine phosphatase family protein [Candidatus Bathyarchaeota archaeon]|nr:histidine phosphatase family protein [Candidatus Bathyarchaeota archaeon]